MLHSDRLFCGKVLLNSISRVRAVHSEEEARQVPGRRWVSTVSSGFSNQTPVSAAQKCSEPVGLRKKEGQHTIIKCSLQARLWLQRLT